MEITDHFEKMTELGHHFLLEHPEIYPEAYIQIIRERFGGFISEERFGDFFTDENEFNAMLYCAIYCQQMYGTNLIEFSSYHFAEKSHEERMQYITWDSRYLYYAFLNKASENHFLDNKYEAYTLLKPFYKREAMLLSDEQDFDTFCDFVKRNPSIFVKPNNLELAEGAHPLDLKDRDDLHEPFEALLKEASEIHSTEVKRPIDHRLILEERIVPSAFIRQMNPDEMALLRVTTILVKGQVHFFYPVLRLLVGDGKVKKGEDYSYVALIDPDSGEVITNGKSGFGDTDVNPLTGKKICGLLMPDWEELKEMLCQAAKMLPRTRYIGWDVTHTDQGWCIIEGNTNGEFFYQMCTGHGLKDEFEDLIGFKVPYDFWKDPMFQKKRASSQA